MSALFSIGGIEQGSEGLRTDEGNLGGNGVEHCIAVLSYRGSTEDVVHMVYREGGTRTEC
jgi:hypothetical protein